MGAQPDLPLLAGEEVDDSTLLAAARHGDVEAYGELWRRHLPTAYAVAQRHRNRAAAEDIVAEAAARVYALIKAGKGPQTNFRAYFLSAVRTVATDTARADLRVYPTEQAELEFAAGSTEAHDPALAVDHEMVRAAFIALPERDQRILWSTTVEGTSPSVVAASMGMTANGVSVTALRARDALRARYLDAHATRAIARAEDDECQWVLSQMGRYVRGKLPVRQRARVEEHLKVCAHAQGLAFELAEVNRALPVLFVPIVFLGGVATKAAWVVIPAAAGGAAVAGSGAAAAPGKESSFLGSLTGGLGAGVVAVAAAGLLVVAGLTQLPKVLSSDSSQSTQAGPVAGGGAAGAGSAGSAAGSSGGSTGSAGTAQGAASGQSAVPAAGSSGGPAAVALPGIAPTSPAVAGLASSPAGGSAGSARGAASPTSPAGAGQGSGTSPGASASSPAGSGGSSATSPSAGTSASSSTSPSSTSSPSSSSTPSSSSSPSSTSSPTPTSTRPPVAPSLSVTAGASGSGQYVVSLDAGTATGVASVTVTSTAGPVTGSGSGWVCVTSGGGSVTTCGAVVGGAGAMRAAGGSPADLTLSVSPWRSGSLDIAAAVGSASATTQRVMIAPTPPSVQLSVAVGDESSVQIDVHRGRAGSDKLSLIVGVVDNDTDRTIRASGWSCETVDRGVLALSCTPATQTIDLPPIFVSRSQSLPMVVFAQVETDAGLDRSQFLWLPKGSMVVRGQGSAESAGGGTRPGAEEQ